MNDENVIMVQKVYLCSASIAKSIIKSAEKNGTIEALINSMKENSNE